nr:hypothetical protein [Anaerolineae bacterium]
MQKVAGTARAILKPAHTRISDTLRFWWRNPLLHHARRLKPLNPALAVRVVVVAAGIFLLLSLLAWIGFLPEISRVVGAVLAAISIGAVMLPALLAPVSSADRIARQMHYARQDPRRLTDLPPGQVAWGLALVTLWRLRWPILFGLALTPSMVVGVLRLDISAFTAWRDSAAVLGGATAAGQSAYLLPGGRIPYVRLVLRAVTGGLLPWGLVVVLSVFGVVAALRIDDMRLSPLAALLGGVLGSGGLVVIWHYLSLNSLLAGPFEVLRMLLLVMLGGLIALLARRLTQYGATILASGSLDKSGEDEDELEQKAGEERITQ